MRVGVLRRKLMLTRIRWVEERAAVVGTVAVAAAGAGEAAVGASILPVAARRALAAVGAAVAVAIPAADASTLPVRRI